MNFINNLQTGGWTTMSKKVYVIPKNTECIAYRRQYISYEPTIESKTHHTKQDNCFSEPLLTPQQYMQNPSKYPGNTYTVQLALQGYMIFTGKATKPSNSSSQRFFLAVPEDEVHIETDNDS